MLRENCVGRVRLSLHCRKRILHIQGMRKMEQEPDSAHNNRSASSNIEESSPHTSFGIQSTFECLWVVLQRVHFDSSSTIPFAFPSCSNFRINLLRISFRRMRCFATVVKWLVHRSHWNEVKERRRKRCTVAKYGSRSADFHTLKIKEEARRTAQVVLCGV